MSAIPKATPELIAEWRSDAEHVTELMRRISPTCFEMYAETKLHRRVLSLIQRVEELEAWLKAGTLTTEEGRGGTVAYIAKRPGTVAVQVDGNSVPYVYPASWWELDAEATRALSPPAHPPSSPASPPSAPAPSPSSATAPSSDRSRR